MRRRIFWEKVHSTFGQREDKDNLAAVCCPQAPLLYNRMFGVFQRRTVLRLLDSIGHLSGRQVLDLGCGSGRWCRLLRQHGATVIGVDLSFGALDRNLKHDLTTSFSQMDIAQLGLRDRCLDGVVSITVLQHLPYRDQSSAIQEISRCIKPGGFVLIVEHTRQRDLADRETQATTFPNSPEQWVEQFERNDFFLVRREPSLLLPLFRAYWLLKDMLVQFRRGRSKASQDGSPGEIPLPKRRGVFARINSLVYTLLTPPSYLLEALLEAVPFLKTWMCRYVPVPQTGFLFRKK